MPWLSIARRDGMPGPEWRRSDWPVTDNLNGGRACPRCHLTAHRGARWRAHWAWHQRRDARLEALEEAVDSLASAVRMLAPKVGFTDWYPPVVSEDEDQEEPGESAPLTGFVIGSGELPPETRGGSDDLPPQ